MILIKNESTDPCFNLATEEFLIDTYSEPTFMLWRNKKAVIIGKNQNTAAEVNREFCENNGIKVVRRLTGGGAVFHDLGNVNYTIIEENSTEKFNNYVRFTGDIIEYLKTLGVNAELSGRNDVLVGGRKIIGNAQCVRNGKIMHHGCILFSADMSDLSGALKVSKAKIQSKGVKSVSSRVLNLKDVIDKDMTSVDFLNGLFDFIKNKYNCKTAVLGEEIKQRISKLSKEKYETFDWNYGTSPDFDFTKTEKFPYGLVTVQFKVISGKIEDLKIWGDFFSLLDIKGLENKINGTEHDIKSLTAVLSSVDIDSFVKGATVSDIVKMFL